MLATNSITQEISSANSKLVDTLTQNLWDLYDKLRDFSPYNNWLARSESINFRRRPHRKPAYVKIPPISLIASNRNMQQNFLRLSLSQNRKCTWLTVLIEKLGFLVITRLDSSSLAFSSSSSSDSRFFLCFLSHTFAIAPMIYWVVNVSSVDTSCSFRL